MFEEDTPTVPTQVTSDRCTFHDCDLFVPDPETPDTALRSPPHPSPQGDFPGHRVYVNKRPGEGGGGGTRDRDTGCRDSSDLSDRVYGKRWLLGLVT